MKAILVMEMPGSCLECPMEMDVEDASGNKWQGNICRGCGKRHADKRKKPEWCPLAPMPERKDERCGLYEKDGSGNWKKCGEKTDLVAAGFNFCLDAIEGREKDGQNN